MIASTASIFTVPHKISYDEDKSEYLTDMDTDSCTTVHTDSSTHWTNPSPVGSLLYIYLLVTLEVITNTLVYMIWPDTI